jgi:hypothetical protein
MGAAQIRIIQNSACFAGGQSGFYKPLRLCWFLEIQELAPRILCIDSPTLAPLRWDLLQLFRLFRGGKVGRPPGMGWRAVSLCCIKDVM